MKKKSLPKSQQKEKIAKVEPSLPFKQLFPLSNKETETTSRNKYLQLQSTTFSTYHIQILNISWSPPPLANPLLEN